MRRTTTLASAGLAVLLAAGSGALADGGMPVPVSPGALDRVPVARSCPTFSWSSEASAGEHQIELAAERTLADGGTHREPLYLVEIPGRGRSWTPSADRCVPPGGSYSWRLRSRSVGDWGSWSEAAHFSVAPRAAPALIRGLLGAAGSTGRVTGPPQPPTRSATLSGPSTETHLVGDPILNVDGVLTVGELRSLTTMTATGNIETTTGLSVAHGNLRARTLQVNTDTTGTVGVRLRTNTQFLELNSPGGANGDGKLTLDVLVAQDLIVGSSITTGRSGWYPPGLDGGGAGFVEVDADDVKLDTSLDSCGTAPLQGVRLRIVDGDQIGVQLECGAVPGQ